MLGRLFAFLLQIVEWHRVAFGVIGSVIEKLSRLQWVLVAVGVALGKLMYDGIVSGIDRITGIWDSLEAAGIGAADGTNLGATVILWMSRINYIFPLAEMLAMLVGLLTLWVVGTTYRLVKSYIPTLT